MGHYSERACLDFDLAVLHLGDRIERMRSETKRVLVAKTKDDVAPPKGKTWKTVPAYDEADILRLLDIDPGDLEQAEAVRSALAVVPVVPDAAWDAFAALAGDEGEG